MPRKPYSRNGSGPYTYHGKLGVMCRFSKEKRRALEKPEDKSTTQKQSSQWPLCGRIGGMKSMTDGDRLRQFHADFEKLKHNREKIPLDILKSKYSSAYEAQVKKVLEGGDWYADAYLRTLAFPTHPQDTAGNEWLQKRIDAIQRKEDAPGGIREQWRAALIDDLDLEKFEDLVYRRYERRLREAFDPYWQRHNKWVGPPGRRWIYNDIFKKYWWPKSENHPRSGCWINRDYTGHDFRFPPNIKEDTQ